MKSVWLFCIITVLAGLCYVMAIPQFYPAVKLPNHDKKIKLEKDKIKKLYEAGQYDSAISYCAWLRKNDKLGYDNLEQALATIYYYKGDKPTAYQYIINQTDYDWKVYTADAFSTALYDFDYAYPIATDTFLEKLISDKIRGYYLAQDFPHASAGLKLVMLHYRLNKLSARYSYDTASIINKSQLPLLQKNFEEAREDISESLLRMLSDHGHFYTYKEAGNGYRFQYSFGEIFSDSAFHAKLKPYYEKSFRSGDITQESYVDELMKSSGILQAETIRYSLFKDSLCKIYKCRPMIRNVTHFNNGDSLVMFEYSDTASRLSNPQPPK